MESTLQVPSRRSNPWSTVSFSVPSNWRSVVWLRAARETAWTAADSGSRPAAQATHAARATTARTIDPACNDRLTPAALYVGSAVELRDRFYNGTPSSSGLALATSFGVRGLYPRTTLYPCRRVRPSTRSCVPAGDCRRDHCPATIARMRKSIPYSCGGGFRPPKIAKFKYFQKHSTSVKPSPESHSSCVPKGTGISSFRCSRY